MLVVILDRVFDRDDVAVEVVVDPVDHARQAGRLPRAGRPGDEDQTSGTLDQLLHDRRQADLLEGQELVRDTPEDEADVAPLLVDRHPEPRGLAEGEAEVAAADLLQLLLAALGRDALHQGRGVRAFEHLRVQRDHVPAQPEHRFRTDGQVEVAGLLGHDRLEQLVDQQRSHGRLEPFPRSPSIPRLAGEPGQVEPLSASRGLTMSCRLDVQQNGDPAIGVAKTHREPVSQEIIALIRGPIKRPRAFCRPLDDPK